MKIAVTSQNRKTVTGHAGRCHTFLIFDVDGGEIRARHWFQLPREHRFQTGGPLSLEGVQVLISAGMGDRLWRRLKRGGVMPVATAEPDPERAVTAWLNGTLAELPPHSRPVHPGRHAEKTPPVS